MTAFRTDNPSFRPLNMGAQAPPLTVFQATRQLMQHSFTKRRQPDNAGALAYSYDTFAAQKMSLIGSGYGYRSGAPLGYGQKPVVARPTVVRQGLAFTSGQMLATPLSDPSDKA